MSANITKACEKAEEVIKENYIVAPPVRIEEIAKNYNLKIVDGNFGKYTDTIAGFIDVEKSTIFVNERDPDTRKAFAVACELGHFLLHKDVISQKSDDRSILYRQPLGKLDEDPLRQEANVFAATLLVPEELLEKYKALDPNTIAKIFGVTQEVIGYRLEYLYGKSRPS